MRVEFAVTGIIGRDLNTLAQPGRRIVKLIEVFTGSDPGRYIHQDIARTAGALIVAVSGCQDDVERRAAEYAAAFGKPEDKVTLDTDIVEDLGADSLDVVEMLMELEDKFNIVLPDEACANLKTVNDIVTFIDSHKK